MTTETRQVIEDALSFEQDKIEFEQLAQKELTPLNQPVVSKESGPEKGASDQMNEGAVQDDPFYQHDDQLDAPVQSIGDEPYDPTQVPDETFELPTEAAQQAAEALLGVTDNFLEIGGGFLVRIKKHKAFYEFDELVQVIDEQNEKNIQRIKLEETDKILLRPLLIAVLKKRAQHLSPEQQLLGAIVSILFKKAQIIVQVRAENQALSDRILSIVKKEKRQNKEASSDPAAEQEEVLEPAIVEDA